MLPLVLFFACQSAPSTVGVNTRLTPSTTWTGAERGDVLGAYVTLAQVRSSVPSFILHTGGFGTSYVMILGDEPGVDETRFQVPGGVGVVPMADSNGDGLQELYMGDSNGYLFNSPFGPEPTFDDAAAFLYQNGGGTLRIHPAGAFDGSMWGLPNHVVSAEPGNGVVRADLTQAEPDPVLVTPWPAGTTTLSKTLLSASGFDSHLAFHVREPDKPDSLAILSQAYDPTQTWEEQSGFWVFPDAPTEWRIIGSGDLDGDGTVDLVVEVGQDSVIVYDALAGGDVGQTDTRLRFTGQSTAIADFDGDGHNDLAIGNPDFNRGEVSIFRGPIEPGDYTWLDGDLVFDVDFAGVLGFGKAMAAVDRNGDGQFSLGVSAPQSTVEGIDYAGAFFLFEDVMQPWKDANPGI